MQELKRYVDKMADTNTAVSKKIKDYLSNKITLNKLTYSEKYEARRILLEDSFKLVWELNNETDSEIKADLEKRIEESGTRAIELDKNMTRTRKGVVGVVGGLIVSVLAYKYSKKKIKSLPRKM